MKNTNLKKMLIAFICLICFFTCYAQTIGEHYYLNSLTIRDGLSQNTVYDILQDKAGFMWFGTKDGLNRYDGSSFKIFKYDRTDEHSLGNNYILALYEDVEGNIWVGTDMGLYIYYPERDVFEPFKQLSDEGTTIDNAAAMIVGDKNGDVWITVERQGIFHYNLQTKALRNHTLKEFPFLTSNVHDELADFVKPGISTLDIDRFGEKLIRSLGCTPNFLNYNGYPASICVSVNDEVVHGIPKKNRILQEGDIVSLDAGLIYKGYHSDAARTHAVGKISPEAQQLINVTRESFFEGIKYAKAGNHLHDISAAIGNYAGQFGYGVVRDLVGHGIGTHLHEDPQIPNFPQKRRGIRLIPGMTLAIEPMINQGRADVEWLDDDWTVVTQDGSLSAHYENTILITEDEPEILTLSR